MPSTPNDSSETFRAVFSRTLPDARVEEYIWWEGVGGEPMFDDTLLVLCSLLIALEERVTSSPSGGSERWRHSSSILPNLAVAVDAIIGGLVGTEMGVLPNFDMDSDEDSTPSMMQSPLSPTESLVSPATASFLSPAAIFSSKETARLVLSVVDSSSSSGRSEIRLMLLAPAIDKRGLALDRGTLARCFGGAVVMDVATSMFG
mmetsp:Transcript_4158/g.8022  ORF Transcript_4158/g.8022 Transcript_4158/m.8022 type:complete len:203 (+) Transcript_4158:1510-2118(+)